MNDLIWTYTVPEYPQEMRCFLWNYLLTGNAMFPVEFSVPGNTMFPVKFSDAWKMPKLLGSENSTGNSAFPGRFLWISWGILKKLFAVTHCKFLCVLYKILPRRIGPSHIISFEKLNKLNNSMKNHFFFY